MGVTRNSSLNASIMSGRLRSTEDYARIRRAGSYWSGKLCSVSAARNAIGAGSGVVPVRVGYITPKKVGGAVQRNRARRLLREAVRTLAGSFQPDWDIVIIARPAISALGVRMQDVREELEWLLRKARILTSR